MSGRLAPGGVVRSILKFVFVVVPTAALATGVVVATSGNRQDATVVADGDLQRDLKLASASNIELAPVGQPIATISAIEAPPSAAPVKATKPKRSSRGTRALRSPKPTVRAAPQPEVAESVDEAATTVAMESAGATAEATEVAPAEGGVALPRPTAIPVSFPGPGGGGVGGTGDGGVYGGGTGDGGVYGPGTVIRGGGGVGDDPCRIHGGWGWPRPAGSPRPRGGSLGDRIRAAQGGRSGGSRGGSIGERVRAAQGRSSESAGSRSSGGSLGGRIRAAQGRSRQ
jgi:hypothetical protein